MATYVKWLKELNSASESEVGYKVASLGEMLNAGLPVPNGFVVLPNAFQKDKLPEDAREEIEAAYSMLDSNPALRGMFPLLRDLKFLIRLFVISLSFVNRT